MEGYAVIAVVNVLVLVNAVNGDVVKPNDFQM